MAGTYPPEEHVLSALGIEVAWRGDDTLVGRALVDPARLGRDSQPPGVGALVPIVDLVAGSRAAPSAGNDWMATADVWLHERAPIESGPIDLETRLLRAGKRAIVVAIEVLAAGRPAVSSTVEFTRIRRDATSHSTGSADVAGGWLRLGGGPLLDTALEEACGFVVTDPERGLVEIERSPWVANSFGTVQGGVIALLSDVSAAAAVGPGARTVDLQFRFLDRIDAGPARASAEIVRSDHRWFTVRVEVVDASDDKLIGWAVCRVLAAR